MRGGITGQRNTFFLKRTMEFKKKKRGLSWLMPNVAQRLEEGEV